MQYKILIMQMIRNMDEKDNLVFLNQIYTLVKRHVEKKQKGKGGTYE